jgi:hypothetical protein
LKPFDENHAIPVGKQNTITTTIQQNLSETSMRVFMFLKILDPNKKEE